MVSKQSIQDPPPQSEPEAEATFYVATGGNDGWSGRQSAPNREGTDGPFATVARARDALRERKASGLLSGPATVLIRGGRYALEETLVFGPEDSGTEACPIAYRAYPGEKPVLSGGRRIDQAWRLYQGEIQVCTIPEAREGGWVFRQLAVDGVRQVRARFPIEGFYEIEEAVSEVAFRYAPGHVQRWRNLEDAEFVVFHSWNESRFLVSELDEEERVVTFRDPHARHTIGWQGAGGPNRYYVENVLEGVQRPGQWYLNRHTGELYLWPMGDLAQAQVVAPALRQLVRFQGDREQGQWVEHLTVAGLTFCDTDWTLPEDGYPDCGDVGDIVEPSAITYDTARACTFEENRVANVGTYALEVNGYGNRIVGNEIVDVGGGGILSRNYDPEHNTFSHNHIHRCGLVYPSAVGINVDEGGGTISHNLIHDISHSGVYTRHWATTTQGRERRNQEQGLVIAHNEIYDVMRVINDGAGIFVRDSNIVIENNLIHDVYAGGSRCPGWGIYLGCETRDTRVANNVVYRTLESVHVWYYNRDVTLENNIFVGGRQCQINYQNPEHLGHENIRFLGNIVYCTEPGGHLFDVSGERSLPAESDYNVIFSTIGCVINDPVIKGLPAIQSFGQWCEHGLDRHSITADPLFVDLANDDLSLQPDSPAYRVGFKAIDLSKVGLRGREKDGQGP